VLRTVSGIWVYSFKTTSPLKVTVLIGMLGTGDPVMEHCVAANLGPQLHHHDCLKISHSKML